MLNKFLTLFKKTPVSEDLLGVLLIIDRVGKFKHRVRLQKYVLIAQKDLKYPFSFNFERYFYGPYSFELKDFMSNLVSEGLVTETKVNLTKGVEYFYELTEVGKSVLSELLKNAEKKNIEIIEKLTKECKDMTDNEVIQKAKIVFGW
jgi:uncharacterized protein YwgA